MLVRLALDVLTKLLIWQRAAAAAVVVEASDRMAAGGFSVQIFPISDSDLV